MSDTHLPVGDCLAPAMHLCIQPNERLRPRRSATHRVAIPSDRLSRRRIHRCKARHHALRRKACSQKIPQRQAIHTPSVRQITIPPDRSRRHAIHWLGLRTGTNGILAYFLSAPDNHYTSSAPTGKKWQKGFAPLSVPRIPSIHEKAQRPESQPAPPQGVCI